LLDQIDVAFAGRLEREIRKRLDGDAKEAGLLRQIIAANDWETFVRMKGIIFAYEEVLEAMREIAREMNEPRRER
jgi:hypothetical protein